MGKIGQKDSHVGQEIHPDQGDRCTDRVRLVWCGVRLATCRFVFRVRHCHFRAVLRPAYREYAGRPGSTPIGLPRSRQDVRGSRRLFHLAVRCASALSKPLRTEVSREILGTSPCSCAPVAQFLGLHLGGRGCHPERPSHSRLADDPAGQRSSLRHGHRAAAGLRHRHSRTGGDQTISGAGHARDRRCPVWPSSGRHFSISIQEVETRITCRP
mmetsp:Transcript_1974/g.5592  ORF Transcript_1974/g.5592 Transcript_1974/m.5592 type:complete len:213 (-) Transcript_1974:368-1006(-)